MGSKNMRVFPTSCIPFVQTSSVSENSVLKLKFLFQGHITDCHDPGGFARGSDRPLAVPLKGSFVAFVYRYSEQEESFEEESKTRAD